MVSCVDGLFIAPKGKAEAVTHVPQERDAEPAHSGQSGLAVESNVVPQAIRTQNLIMFY
jgi:hypothetical protein